MQQCTIYRFAHNIYTHEPWAVVCNACLLGGITSEWIWQVTLSNLLQNHSVYWYLIINASHVELHLVSLNLINSINSYRFS